MNDDLISRQALLERTVRRNSIWKGVTNCKGENLEQIINDLLSVPAEQTHEEWCTDCKEYDKEQHCCHRYCKVIRQAVAEIKQAERTGHWNNNTCSECGYKVMPWNETRYCPNCGCAMVEPQERRE